MTILIVDDVPLIRNMLIECLADASYTATGAANGLEALHCLRTQPFQLVLLDVMMPIMNGWDMLKAMRAERALALIPVVMMTAVDNVRELALLRGAIGYLPKPIDLDNLLDIIGSHISS